MGSTAPDINSIAAGAMAGVTGLIGLASLYKGLASGQMGIVAPLAAVTTATLPVCWGMYLEGFSSSLQVMGFLVAFAAIWLLLKERLAGRQWIGVAAALTAILLIAV